MCNSARWAGKYDALAQFAKLRPYLLEAHDDDNTNFHLNRSQVFANTAIKHEKQLKLIKRTTAQMQKRLHESCDCRANLDMLLEDAERNKGASGHDLHDCDLSNKRIGPNSSKMPDLHFQKGVVKIQMNDIVNMTPEEHQACKKLRLNEETNAGGAINSSNMSHQERLEAFKRRRLCKCMTRMLHVACCNCSYLNTHN